MPDALSDDVQDSSALDTELRPDLAAQEGSARHERAPGATRHVDHPRRPDAEPSTSIASPSLVNFVRRRRGTRAAGRSAQSIEHKVIRPHLVRSRRRLRAWPCSATRLRASCAAAAGRPRARAGGPADAHAMPVAAEKDGSAIARGYCADSPASARSRPRPSPSCGPGSATPIAPPRTACRPVVPRDHARPYAT